MRQSKWRLLETGHSTARFNMALDEAIMEARAERKVPPTLRLYGWKPWAVSIGYFQRLREDVNVERCRELGIDIVRRMTGGGAVLHDAEITYSVAASEKDLIPRSMRESYELICAGIIEGLRHAGIEARLSTQNDIVVGLDKISGNAQLRRKGTILQHGTILLDADQETTFSVLKSSGEKSIRGRTCMAKGNMTSLKDLNIDQDFQTMSRCLYEGFEKVLDTEFSRETPTEEELEKAETLSRTKYSSREWNERR
jgi:lipoate-protein ligase A